MGHSVYHEEQEEAEEIEESNKIDNAEHESYKRGFKAGQFSEREKTKRGNEMSKCELCEMETENISEHDDCNGQPHLVCDFCWENLEETSYEPLVVE